MYEYKYTVIIPYFKASLTIRRLLASIPERKDIQVIIVNDKCKTFSQINGTSRQNLYLFENETTNSGAGVCRNIGLKHVKGEYLIFADADDYFINDAFVIFDNHSSKNVDIVYFEPTSIIEVTEEISKRHLFYSMLVDRHIKINAEDIRYRFFAPWSKLIKSKFVLNNDIKFDEVIASNDINFSLKIGVIAKNITAYKINVYCVVESNVSLTKLKTKEVIDSRFYAMCNYNNLLAINNLKSWQLPMFQYLRAYRKFGINTMLVKLMEVIKHRSPIFFTFNSFITNMKFRLNNN